MGESVLSCMVRFIIIIMKILILHEVFSKSYVKICAHSILCDKINFLKFIFPSKDENILIYSFEKENVILNFACSGFLKKTD